MVLTQTGASRSNRAVETARGDIDCLLEGVDLFGGLDDPHRPDRRHWVENLTDVAAVALAAGTTPDDEVGNETVEPPVRSERVVHRPGLGEEFRQLLVQFFDRKSLVGSQQGLRRAIHPNALPDPYLVLRIKRVDEEDVRLLRART